MDYIVAENVDFAYPRKENIFTNFSLSLSSDEFTVIIGPNGGGKTTLGKLLVGIYKPLKGNVYVCEQNTKDLSLGELGKKIGYLFQNPNRQIIASTVKEDIAFTMKFDGIPQDEINKRCDEVLDFFELKHLENKLPYNLSHGEKQRLALASILVNNPQFLILDEPTTSLDIIRKKELSHFLIRLKKRGVGMAIITHDLNFAKEHADRKIYISRGEIIEDTR